MNQGRKYLWRGILMSVAGHLSMGKVNAAAKGHVIIPPPVLISLFTFPSTCIDIPKDVFYIKRGKVAFPRYLAASERPVVEEPALGPSPQG